jgi:vancomycin aglycone glucosyltransferase
MPRPLKIVLAPVGTRGDVQPLLALGLRLQEEGHQVILCAPSNDRSWAESLGLPFAPLEPDIRSSFRHVRDCGLLLVHEIAKNVPAQFHTLLRAAEGADLIVGANLQIAGPSIAELMHIPYYYVLYSGQLAMPAGQRPMGLPWETVPAWLDRAHRAIWPKLWDLYFGVALRRERRALGLSPVEGVFSHVVRSGRLLFAFDPRMSPVPRELDALGDVTGPWYFDGDERLEASVERFLDEGPPPIYIGFGSMPSQAPAALTDLLFRAVRTAGARAIICSGWAGLGAADVREGCLFLGSVSHSLLFPRVRAAVHHGGAGTTAAAARAGIPQILVPHFADQFYWAGRTHELGIGPRPIPRSKMTADNLAEAIRSVATNPAMRTAAQAMGEHLRNHDGLTTALRIIESAV